MTSAAVAEADEEEEEESKEGGGGADEDDAEPNSDEGEADRLDKRSLALRPSIDIISVAGDTGEGRSMMLVLFGDRSTDPSLSVGDPWMTTVEGAKEAA